jgi:hypothetical protein
VQCITTNTQQSALREASITQALSPHPNIVLYLGAFRYDTTKLPMNTSLIGGSGNRSKHGNAATVIESMRKKSKSAEIKNRSADLKSEIQGCEEKEVVVVVDPFSKTQDSSFEKSSCDDLVSTTPQVNQEINGLVYPPHMVFQHPQNPTCFQMKVIPFRHENNIDECVPSSSSSSSSSSSLNVNLNGEDRVSIGDEWGDEFSVVGSSFPPLKKNMQQENMQQQQQETVSDYLTSSLAIMFKKEETSLLDILNLKTSHGEEKDTKEDDDDDVIEHSALQPSRYSIHFSVSSYYIFFCMLVCFLT